MSKIKLNGYTLYDNEDALIFAKENNLPLPPPKDSNKKDSGTIHMHIDWNTHPIIIVSEKIGKAHSLGFWKYITVK